MEDLEVGDKLILTADGSEWQFVHYSPINSGMLSYADDGSVDDSDGPPNSQNKNFVHVKPWGLREGVDGGESKHEQMPTDSFHKT